MTTAIRLFSKRHRLVTIIATFIILTLSFQITIHAEDNMSGLHKLNQPTILNSLFHPRYSPKSPPPTQALNLDFQVEQDITIGSRLFTADKNAPVIIFFHGNGEIVEDYNDIGPYYNELGLNFLVTDYRGYGWSNGTPQADTLISDARTLFDKITSWLEENDYQGKIFVMGRSMGSACAIDLTFEFGDKINGLIIESGFAETIPLMKTLGLEPESLNINEEDCFNNHRKISSIATPTYILHGQKDSLIPIKHAEQLHAESGAKSKELVIIPGADHNSVIAVAGSLYFQAIKGFIDKVTGTESWRDRRKRFRKNK